VRGKREKGAILCDFPGPILRWTVFEKEAAQWAYENIDAKELYPAAYPETFFESQGMPLSCLGWYLRFGIFPMAVAPEFLSLRTITLAVSSQKGCILGSESDLTLLERVKFKRDARVKFVIIEKSFVGLPAKRFCKAAALLKPFVDKLAVKGISVDIEAAWKRFYDDVPFIEWNCKHMLGSGQEEWMAAVTTVLLVNDGSAFGPRVWRVSMDE
jgi:hypothetical protein